MKFLNKILIFNTITGLLLFHSSVSADWMDKSHILTGSSSRTVSDLKGLRGQMNELITEHDALEHDVALLSHQYEALRAQVQQEKFYIPQDSQMNFEKIASMVPPGMSPEDQRMIIENRVALLKKSIIDLDGQIKTWQLRYKDLDRYQRQLRIESKIKDFNELENLHNEENKSKMLSQKLQLSLARETELEHEYHQMQRNAQITNKDVSVIRESIKDLSAHVAQLEEQKEIKVKEVSIWENKLEYLKQKWFMELEEKVQTRNMLNKLLKELQHEYNQLSSDVDSSMSAQQIQKELYDRVIVIDKENRAMMEQISLLEGQLEEKVGK